MLTIIWYLIIVNRHGTATVEEPSREACINQIEFVKNRGFTLDAYCISGVKP